MANRLGLEAVCQLLNDLIINVLTCVCVYSASHFVNSALQGKTSNILLGICHMLADILKFDTQCIISDVISSLLAQPCNYEWISFLQSFVRQVFHIVQEWKIESPVNGCWDQGAPVILCIIYNQLRLYCHSSPLSDRLRQVLLLSEKLL